MKYIGIIIYYLFSLLFMIGQTNWDDFPTTWGKIGYLILVLLLFSWAMFPATLGLHFKENK